MTDAGAERRSPVRSSRPGRADVSAPSDSRHDGGNGPARGDPVTDLLGGVAVAAVAGVLLVLTARHSALALLIGVAVVQGALAFGWVLGTAMPGRKGGMLVGALAAAGADVAASLFPHGGLGALLIVIGLSVPVMFVHQLTRGAARTKLVSSLSGIAMLVLAEVALASLLQLRHAFTDPGLGGRAAEAAAGAIAAALVVAGLVDLVLPVPRFDPQVRRGLPGVIAAAVIGGAIAYLLLRDEPEFAGARAPFVGAALGALAGLLGVATAFIAGTARVPTSRASLLRPVYIGLLPLCVLAPVAYLLCLATRV